MMDHRKYWLETMLKIVNPVFENLSCNSLRKHMPVECHEGLKNDREKYTHLEALGRSLAGIGPWLELEKLDGNEKSEQIRMQNLVLQSIDNATNPKSADYMNFKEGSQPIVDAAFLAVGLRRSYKSIWLNLENKVQEQVIQSFKLLRDRAPFESNWLLFSGVTEAFIQTANGDGDPMRIDYSIRQHEQWYKGDGIYGDGPNFHWDYYNSFVIQPFILQIIEMIPKYDTELFWKRAIRYATVLERLIAPDGSYPPIGRSLVYRFGAFQHLAEISYQGKLENHIKPAQVRCALTAVIQKTMEAGSNFDNDGWLKIGLCGSQPFIGETYISTGSLYLCLCGLLPLGLHPTDSFWSSPDENWTSKSIWSGEENFIDNAIH
ncbi:MAG: hypothetical protein COA79_06280 [Planctomycetota bacterium]|nr:MAG: hypothetical protein COA79_06280 [Planctomycetota bacterium]